MNKSKWKKKLKPMIALDKNRNCYTCGCKTNFLVEGSQKDISIRPNKLKSIF